MADQGGSCLVEGDMYRGRNFRTSYDVDAHPTLKHDDLHRTSLFRDERMEHDDHNAEDSANLSESVNPDFADTECAQALLDLATSFCPSANFTGKTQSQDNLPEVYDYDNRDSILKHHFEEQEYPNGYKKKRKSDPGNKAVQEVIERIKLDHSYAIDSSAEEGLFKSGLLHSAPLKLHNNNHVNQKVNKKVSPKSRLSPRKSKRAVDNCVGDLLQLKESLKPRVGLGDVYEPENRRYEKFNLLLKCLTDEGGFEETQPGSRTRYDSNASSNRLSLSSGESPSGSSEDSATVGESGLLDADNQFHCALCGKSFTKKRYLTKHFRRMHPSSACEQPAQCTSCKGFVTKANLPHHRLDCKQVTKPELSDCQFCGIRMRHRILVQHLALEHCQEVAKGATDTQLTQSPCEEDLDALSDTSTLSGSEHDHSDVLLATSPRQPPNKSHTSRPLASDQVSNKLNYKFHFGQSILTKNTVQCQLCDQRVSRMQLTDHLATVHNATSRGVQSTDEDAGQSKSSRCQHSMLQRFLSDTTNQELECQSCVSQLVRGPDLTEAQVPDLTEEMRGPDLTEEMRGPDLTEEMRGPDLTEEMRGPDLIEEMPRPDLTEEMRGPDLAEEMRGSDLTEKIQKPNLTEEMQGPDLTEEIQGPDLTEARGPDEKVDMSSNCFDPELSPVPSDSLHHTDSKH